MATTTPTRSARLFERVRGDILSGALPPGSRLPFADLVDRYSCSIGSLREALQRLSEVGLVEAVAQQGFSVVEVSVEDLNDLMEARLEIEVAALRHSIEDGDVGWEAASVAAHHVLERTAAQDPEDPDRFSEDWAQAHGDFHRTLLSGCKNRRILAAAAALRDSAELYRRWSIPFGRDKRRDSAGEHRALLDAAVHRDADRAAELLREHILNTRYDLLPGAIDGSAPSSLGETGDERRRGSSRPAMS